MRGLDWSFADLPVEDMPRWGYTVAFQYLCYQYPNTIGKVLTVKRRDRILAVMDLIPNWEWYSSRAKEGYSSGYADGLEAHRQLVNLGYPGGRIVAVSDDSYTDASNVNAVLEYFRGFMAGCPHYDVRPYGNRYCMDAFHERYQRGGWQNREDHRSNVPVSPHAFAYQTGNQAYNGGADENLIYPGYTSWKVGVPANVPSPQSQSATPLVSGDTELFGYIHKQTETLNGKAITVYYVVAGDLSCKQVINDPGTLAGLIATKQYIMHPAGGEYLSQAQVSRIPLAPGSHSRIGG